MTNLPATLSTLNREIGVLTERLAQVDYSDIAVAIDVLKRGGMLVPVGISSANMIEEYRKAMASVPKVGLSIAVSKLKVGEYPRKDYAFIPHPAELAAMGRAEARQAREDLIRKREALDSMTYKAPEIDRSPEVVARVRAMREHAVEALRATHTPIVQEPLSAEQAEYWAKIQSLNDAKTGITAEQAAFRRKVSADLDAVKPNESERGAA